MRKPFERAYWVIPGKLLAGPYPGDKFQDEARRKIVGLLDCGIRHVVNLMEEDEVDHSGHRFVPYEGLLGELAGQRGVAVSTVRSSIRDMQVPTPEEMAAILEQIDGSIESGRPVYLHCWGGRGRTGTVVGCYLVRQGLAGEEALQKIEELRRDTPDARGASPETRAQREMVLRWGEMNRAEKRREP